MLPERLIPATIEQGRIVPSYLGPTDLPWLNTLLDEFNRFCGKPTRELDAHLALPLAHAGPPFKARAAIAYLRKIYQPGIVAQLKPQTARESLFLAAAESGGLDRQTVLLNTASLYRVSSQALERAITADLPGERLVAAPDRLLTTSQISQAVNELLVRGLIGRARVVCIRAEGSIRAIVRQAKFAGLLCTLREDQTGLSLEISGPFSLFRHTRLYARALGSLLGRLPYCARFELKAVCQLRGQVGLFILRSDDRLFQISPGAEPRAFDSTVEARFARALRRLAPDWDLVREPEAIQIGSTFIFPDFALTHRLDPDRRFLIEIVGFWTKEYVTRKLAALRQLGHRNLIVCIDDTLACDASELPVDAFIVRYHRRVRPEDVLAAIGACPTAPARPVLR